MYVDVRRRLVFFDASVVAAGVAGLVQYDVATGKLEPVKGASADDVVMHATGDGRRLALKSAKWLMAYGKNRVRLTFLKDGTQTYQTDKFMFFWARLDPTGKYALVSGNASRRPSGRPFVIDLDTGEVGRPISGNLDARAGDIDPLDGKVWAPDGRYENSVLSVDCRNGEIKKVRIPIGGTAIRLRFSHDGASLFVTGSNSTVIRCDRDGSPIWSAGLAEYGDIALTDILLNESCSHLCVPLASSKRSQWGEDMIISVDKGEVEKTIVRHRGPPARLATDWFGDRLLTHSGEIIDFFSGEVLGTAIPKQPQVGDARCAPEPAKHP
jgi:hypothetical protein